MITAPGSRARVLPQKESTVTKKVRIENADTANYKVVVQVWDKGYPEGMPDKLVTEYPLANPCDMTPPELYITSTRYLVVKEAS